MMQSDLTFYMPLSTLFVARQYLRETLAIASDAELNKLTASALVLLAQIYLALGTRKVRMYLNIRVQSSLQVGG